MQNNETVARDVEKLSSSVVVSAHSTSHFRKVDPDLLYFERETFIPHPLKTIDVFSNYWGLAFGEIAPGILSFNAEDLVPVSGPSAMFVPPFSIIEWVLHQPGSFRWASFTSSRPLPAGFPDGPVIFSLPAEQRPASFDEIVKLLSSPLNFKKVGKVAVRSPIALKLKRRLDLEFRLNKSISEYASEFGISHEVMTRYFTLAYGIPPLEYRGKMRLFEAMMRIAVLGEPVNRVCFEVGFDNLRSFNRLFKKYMRTQPSKYRIS